MGKTQQNERLSHAARGRPAGGLAARSHLIAFWRDERGATAIEYGLICALVFLAIITSVTAFGNKTSNIMIRVSSTLSNVVG